jgi:cation diffusion facilitator CzcD-associated flavoprotein CzcO
MSALSTLQDTSTSGSRTRHDVVVIGAGPYGLSITAHLRAKGLNVAIFGRPMELWRERMPEGMFLRSHWWGTNLSDPHKKYGFAQFFQASEYEASYPVPIQTFIDYALWFQKNTVPAIDPTYVSTIERQNQEFVLTLEDGRVVETPAVIMAVGLRYYQRIPSEYPNLPTELLAHAYEHGDFSRYAGKKVAIIGGGQSAVEYSALLHEAGASVDLIARRPISWLGPDNDDPRSLIARLRAPNSAIAPGWKTWGLEAFPYLFQKLPLEKRVSIVKNNHHPGGSEWLIKRVIGHVHLHEGQTVTKMTESDGGVALTISDNTRLQVDHVMLTTGYEADVSRMTLLSPSLISEVKTHLGSPILNPWFESNVPGLYFVGFSSLQSFGPLYRFVAGVPATAPRVAHAVTRRLAKLH